MLQPLAKPDVSTERLLQNLESIFRVAAELAFLLYRQRADWIVKYPFSKTCVFDGNTMEDIDDDEDGSHSGVEKEFPKQVEIFVFPGLYKRGNADGEGYDVESCMVKAKVRCVRFGS
jgi:hypothetical protein